MKKIILSTIILSSLLFSEQIRIIPIDKSLLAQENGGNKSAIEAYSDGVGIVTESNQIIDNSPMNTLVFQYGEEAKKEGSTLKNYSLNNGTNEEKDLANQLGQIGELNNLEGTSCNDNNVQTVNDKYVNGICAGTNVEGQSCNDGNSQTINDKYVSGVCAGTNVEGQSCNDNNAKTINDKYVNGVCIGTNVEGQSCNDNNAKTINDKYVNGVCIGTNVEGQSCNDGNAQTINDKYVSGICVGTNVEGQSCNDGNAQTINDKYVSGVCVGTITYYKTCLELYNKGERTNNYYNLDVDGPTGPLPVNSFYCDMNNGGLTHLNNIANVTSTTFSSGTTGLHPVEVINPNNINYPYFVALTNNSSYMYLDMEFLGTNTNLNFYDSSTTSIILYTTTRFSRTNKEIFINYNPKVFLRYIYAHKTVSSSISEKSFAIYSSTIKFK